MDILNPFLLIKREAEHQYYKDKCAEWNLTKEVIENFILKEDNYGSNKELS